MTPRFCRSFRVRHYELNPSGHLSPVIIVQYMQEAAIEASTALGFSPDWYRQKEVAWVVRRLWVRYFSRLRYRDEVEITTWVSTMRGVRSNREYVLTRLGNGEPVARGRVEWIYVNARTGQPIRCPDEWAASVPPKDEGEELLGVSLGDGCQTEGVHRYHSPRRAQFHEIDVAQHVNHAVYLRWVEEAGLEALRNAAHSIEPAAWSIFQEGHEAQYLAPTVASDEIEVVSWVGERDTSRLVWVHELSHSDTKKLLVRDLSRWSFTDDEGKPTAVPPEVIDDVLRGPRGE